MQTLNEHGPQPTADDKPQWPRDFDFSGLAPSSKSCLMRMMIGKSL
jgi:hypothetical protein